MDKIRKYIAYPVNVGHKTSLISDSRSCPAARSNQDLYTDLGEQHSRFQRVVTFLPNSNFRTWEAVQGSSLLFAKADASVSLDRLAVDLEIWTPDWIWIWIPGWMAEEICDGSTGPPMLRQPALVLLNQSCSPICNSDTHIHKYVPSTSPI